MYERLRRSEVLGPLSENVRRGQEQEDPAHIVRPTRQLDCQNGHETPPVRPHRDQTSVLLDRVPDRGPTRVFVRRELVPPCRRHPPGVLLMCY